MKKSFILTSETLNDYKRLHISAKIDSHEFIIEDSFLGEKYVLYNIKIFTCYKDWLVKKRYSNFEDLNRSLKEKIKNINFSDFPPKRVFKNSETTIKERKQKFEDYLNFLFRNVNICIYDEILQFIEIEKELLALLMKNNTMIESKTSMAVKRYYSMNKMSLENVVKKCKSLENENIKFNGKQNYYSTFLEFKLQDKAAVFEKSANLMVVEEFLRNLDFKFENKCEIVKTFEGFLKSKKNWPSFKKEEISRLFYGDTPNLNNLANSVSSDNSNNSKLQLKGLFYHIGNTEQNVLGAEACLEFLGKLIDYEYNPDVDAYIFMLKTSKVENIITLRLNDHIKSNKINIINICFRVIKAIVNEDKQMLTKLRKIICEDDIIDKFLFWFENNENN